MMLIGTSLGGCLKSILAGEVSEDDVLVIIARTRAESLEQVVEIAEGYYLEGNPHSRSSDRYSFDDTGIELEDAKSLAARLFLAGKIHQPRNYGHHTGFIHPEMSRMSLWMEVNPIGLNENPLVVDAYSKYKMLDALTK